MCLLTVLIQRTVSSTDGVVSNPPDHQIEPKRDSNNRIAMFSQEAQQRKVPHGVFNQFRFHVQILPWQGAILNIH